VQVGIGGWQVPREAVKVARERETNIITMADMEEMGIDKTAEMALEMAWDGVDMVYMSFDIDSIDCGFVPGTGWPEPGGFLPREALALASKVAAEGICGMELVEVSPPYDTSDITALMGTRVIVDVLGSLVASGRLGAHRAHRPARGDPAWRFRRQEVVECPVVNGAIPHRQAICTATPSPGTRPPIFKAQDKTSFLRLAGIPFERPGKGGATALKLVDVALRTDWQVGTAAPSFGRRTGLSALSGRHGRTKCLIHERAELDIRDLLAARGADPAG
jgi:hypothetical protein